jgi:hypothetical protein
MKKVFVICIIFLFFGFDFQPTFAIENKLSDDKIVNEEQMNPDFIIDTNQNTIIGNSVQPMMGPPMFEQLPLGENEDWIFHISDADAGYRVWDEFWDLQDSICCIRFWGLSLINSGEWTSCDPQGMVFEIIFWDALFGNPICTYQVSPKAKGTFEFYNGSKMFYWEVILDPLCKISDGWVSIQSIGSSNNCCFYWAGSDEGNLYCYHEGATNPDCENDCAFQLISIGCGFHEGKIQCESVGMNFGKAKPGTTVTGQIYIYNKGSFYSWLDWFVDTVNVPTWGTWTFSPASGINLREYDYVIINVSCVLTDIKDIYNGSIIVYNADDSTDICEIDTSVEISKEMSHKAMNWNYIKQSISQFVYTMKI